MNDKVKVKYVFYEKKNDKNDAGIVPCNNLSVLAEAAFYACSEGTTPNSQKQEEAEKWGET